MVRCSACRKVVPERARFCPACGERLSSPATPSELTRKTVTVLFSDISGFTELGEQLDPESVHSVMDRFFTEMAGVVERHGGIVEKFIGDEVMALFGVPAVHEDDVLRGARAALEMRAVLDGLNEELASRWDIRLSVRTGINTGEVAAGVLATGDAITYGDPVNVAKRLETAAAPGEILVGETTAHLLSGRATLTALAPLRLKGKPELVEAWRLEDVAPDIRPITTAAAARPLVGRASELRLLREAFDAVVHTRRPKLVTVSGPAGIGKSRLADELLDGAAERATVATGRCLSYGEGITYFPVAEIVRRLADRSDEAAIAELAGGGEEGARIASRIAHAVGFSRGTVAVEEARWAVRRLLEIQAEQRPLIIVIDDLHWAQPTLLELLEHVVTSAANVPLLWLLLGRDELSEGATWARVAPARTKISLGPLGDQAASALVAGVAADTVDPEERDLLLATAEGNPLFLEQLVASRAESGAAAARPPPTIQALLAARIDALPRPERKVIDRAAVEGRDFHRGAVAALLPAAARGDLDAALAALERRELLGRWDSDLPGETGYRFAHLLVRDVAYELLPKAARAELHEVYADWLEQRPIGTYNELVGYHLEQAYRCHTELHPGAGAQRAGLASRAARCLEAAGRRAIDRGDLPAGVKLLERSIALIPADEHARGAMVPELGIALVQLGRLAEAEHILTTAVGDARAARDPVAEAHATTARFFARVQVASASAVAELDERFEELRRVFSEAGDELGLARLWRAQALVHWLAGQSRLAEDAWTRAVAHARHAGHEQGATDAMCWLASVAHIGPTPVAEAIRRCESILAELHVDRRSQALVIRPLATLHAMAGRIDDARALLDRANAILDDLGVGLTSSAGHYDAWVALLAGDAAGAEAALRAGYAALDQMGERALLATTAAMLARALYLVGNHDEALAFADAAQQAAADDDLSAQILARTARAQVLAHRGETTAAKRLSAEAVAMASRTDWLNEQADAMMVHAEVLLATGDAAAAKAARKEAVNLYERKGNVMAAERALAIVKAT